jgi:hypothetical protein
MAFEKCPECGETNYQEQYSHRTFDCGFVGFGSTRSNRCGRPKKKLPAVDIPAEVSRYRLALLDAAQVADSIAADMMADGQSAEFARRCSELAKQMREFAGHGPNGFASPRSGAQRSGLISIFRRR